MIFRQRNRPQEKKIIYRDSGLLRLGVLALIGYIIVSDARERNWYRGAEPPAQAAPDVQVARDEGLAGPPLPEQPSARTAILSLGSGNPVQCGDEVTVTYSSYLDDGTLFDERKSDAPLTFTPGRREAARALELGVIGMKPGETRQIIAPPGMASGTLAADGRISPPGAWLAYKVTLQNAAAQVPDAPMALKRFEEKKGEGWEARCGGTVHISFRAYTPDGALVRETPEPVPYIVGGWESLPGLDQGLLGAPAGGKYFLAIPPQLLTPRHSAKADGASYSLGLPSGSALLIEISLDKVD